MQRHVILDGARGARVPRRVQNGSFLFIPKIRLPLGACGKKLWKNTNKCAIMYSDMI
mgnify:CR=1 FL=1